MPPPPPVPPGLDRLSEEELRLMEGTERRHVEERIKFLRNVQTLLDASSALMGQYQALSVQYPMPQTMSPVVVVPATEATHAEQATGVVVAGDEVDVVEVGECSSSSSSRTKVTLEATKLEDQVTIRDVIEEEEEGEGGTSTTTPASSPNDEFAEVRRRRLERFSTTSSNANNVTNNNDKIDSSAD